MPRFRLLFSLLPLLPLGAPPSRYYVSPTGSDESGDGSAASPWATWSHAVSAVRPQLAGMTSDIVVTFAPGRYALSSAVLLTPADSGRNGWRVVYQGGGSSPGDVLFDGGVALSGWAEDPPGSGVFSAALPVATREVYAFGARLSEAAAPGVNLTSTNTDVTAWGYVTRDAALLSAVAAGGPLIAPADVELLYTSAGAQWQEARCRVAAWEVIEGGGALNITMAQPGWALTRGKAYPERLPTAVLNVLQPASLQPGQAVLSPSRRRVWARPPAGAPGGGMAAAEAWVGGVDGELLLLEGTRAARGQPAQPVHHVAIENLSLRGATWLAPTEEGAYAPDQGGIVYRAADLPAPLAGHALHPVPAALTLRAAANASLSRVWLAHVGGSALAVEGGSQDVAIDRARIEDVGCSGVRLGEVADAAETEPAALNARLSLSDSVLQGLAVGYRDCSGVFGGFITGSTLAHNALSDANWAGVTLGWGGWGGCGYRPSLGGNRIIGNVIQRVNVITGDGGPIYVRGAGRRGRGGGRSGVAQWRGAVACATPTNPPPPAAGHGAGPHQRDVRPE